MLVTDAMLQAAVRKAVEVELLPKSGFIDVVGENWQKIKAVLEAALAEADAGRHATVPPPAEPFPWCRFVVHGEFLYGIDDRAVAERFAEDLTRRSGRKAWVVDRIIE